MKSACYEKAKCIHKGFVKCPYGHDMVLMRLLFKLGIRSARTFKVGTYDENPERADKCL